MSRFLLQRKLMTFADRYSIRDEQGEDAYLARGQWMSIGKKIHVKDREGKEVALLQRKLGTLRPQFVITIPGLPEILVAIRASRRLQSMARTISSTGRSSRSSSTSTEY